MGLKVIKNCLVCEEEINRGQLGVSRNYKSRRGDRGVTCSRKCARIYDRVAHLVLNRRKYYDKENGCEEYRFV